MTAALCWACVFSALSWLALLASSRRLLRLHRRAVNDNHALRHRVRGLERRVANQAACLSAATTAKDALPNLTKPCKETERMIHAPIEHKNYEPAAMLAIRTSGPLRLELSPPMVAIVLGHLYVGLQQATLPPLNRSASLSLARDLILHLTRGDAELRRVLLGQFGLLEVEAQP